MVYGWLKDGLQEPAGGVGLLLERAQACESEVFPEAARLLDRGSRTKTRHLRISRMEEKTIDRAAMGRLAKALVFVCGPDHPTTMALQAAAESGSERDLKNARTLFLRLKPGERR